jgi:hypothetical protein
MVAVAMLAAAAPAVAQDGAGAKPVTDVEWRAWVPDQAAVSMPALAFAERPEDASNYQKYYYFHRADTSFADALTDIRQCDEFARGLYGGDYYPDPAYTAMYGVGGALGGAIGGALAQAIYGSAEERRKRRVNMRRCMSFKGYERYGLSKDLWEKFNFEEGNRSVPEAERQQMLAMQAKVASGPLPSTEGLGL